MAAGASYHRWFEGWTERRERIGGRTRTRRYYSGEYRVAALEKGTWRGHGTRLVALYTLSAACLIAGGCLPVWTNGHVLVALFELILLVGLLCQLPPLLSVCLSKGRLTKGEWRERGNLVSMARGLTVVFALLAAVRVVLMIAARQTAEPLEWLSALLSAIGAGVAERFRRAEGKVQYRLEQSDETVPKDGYDICYREQ